MSNPALRLTRKDGLGILALLAIGAVSLAIAFQLFPTVFPEATIKFDVDRKQSRVKAEALLRDMQFDISGYRYASSFVYDDSAKVFLERELGLARMNDAVAKTAKIWRWSHRWYKPLQKEEYTVEIAPTGELVRILRQLAEDSPGERLGTDETMPQTRDLSKSTQNRLSEEDARALAERFIARVRPAGTADLRYLGATARDWQSRTDRTFTWEDVGIDWKGGRYRHKVVVQGDRVGGYEEFVQVPEAWSRDYMQLRSKNEAAGAVDTIFFVLTILAMIVMIFLRFRGHMIRWRFAVTFGIVGACLAIFTALNNLPQALYDYDTTRSFGGFVSSQIINMLLQGLVIGAMILVITASGETLYRSAYPKKMALPKIFTWRGLRTKEFFFSTLGGLILTAFFIAYQCIFYRVATSLGAWSPADVPYDDLLNSAFPWAFLLFIGFLPAVSEEFMSRAFSIPFFHKILKSRVAAVILAGFIWGFGHATYPNQPFYIRGLEVGIAGVLIGIIMIRFNMLTGLVWHFTVDAFLSAYLLFRSGNSYYVLTAAVASGIMVLPFLVSLVAYLRTGRFSDPEALRHQAEPQRAAVAATPVAASAAAFTAAAVQDADEEAGTEEDLMAPRAVSPTDNRLILRAVVVTAAALAVMIFVTKRYEVPDTTVKVDRATAIATANGFLSSQGLPTGGYRSVYDFSPAMSSNEPRYVMQQSGLAGLTKTYPDVLPAQVWTLRMFKELKAEEFRVQVEATTGRVVGFEHRVAEGDSLPSVTAAAAESLSAGLLASVGLATTGMDRKEAADDPRPKRMDRHFAWEGADGDARNAGEARYRLEGKVAGDKASGLDVTLRLPEAYERLREKRTAVTGVLIGLMILGGLGCFGVALRDASKAHMAGVIPWRMMLRFGPPGVILALIGVINGWPRFVFNYQSTMAWSTYLVTFGVAIVMASVLYFFLGWVLSSLGRGLQPSSVLLGNAAARRTMIPGALLALILVPIWAKTLGLVRVLLAGAFPRFAGPPGLDAAGYLDMLSPALAVIVSTIVSTFLGGFIVAAALRVLRSGEWPGRPLRLLLFAALAVGFILGPTRGAGEAMLGLLRLAIMIAVAYGLVRWLLRDNPLAYLAGLYGYFAFRGAGGLLEQPSSWARMQGIVALVVLLVPVVWVVVRRGKGPAAEAS
jgi:membrane protease YdiL (CAAX protease family)